MERVGEARPWLWARQKWPVAMVVLGRERESEGEERRGLGRVRWVRGGAWQCSGVPGQRGGRQAGSCVPARTASGTASPLPTGKRRKTAMPLVGWARTEMGRPEAPGKKPR